MIRAKKRFANLLLVALILFTVGALGQQKTKQTRTFWMGFTSFPPDLTEEADKDVAQFLNGNADIIAQHMESVPWTEALNGEPFRENLMNSWRHRKAITPSGAKVYVAVNPGRGDLADYWGANEHDPLPAQFKGKTFSDPLVKRAYLNYCKKAIEFFNPDYLAIGIEVNEVALNSPDKFAAYAELHEYVYTELKKQYPKLPIFASFTLHGFLDTRRPEVDRQRALTAFKNLMPYDDVIAISFYPFFGNLSDQVDSSFSWLTAQFDEFRKPYAFAETGEAADKLTLQVNGSTWVINGSPARQEAYYEKLFALAQSQHMEFIITFLYKDYDLLWKKIADKSPPVFQAWQDNGLVDENGVPRPAYKLWKQFYEMPRQK